MPTTSATAELAQRGERAGQKRSEATRGDGGRRRDQAPGLADRADDARTQAEVTRFFVQPRHQKDVIVDPDRHEEDEQEVRDLPVQPFRAEPRTNTKSVAPKANAYVNIIVATRLTHASGSRKATRRTRNTPWE